MKFKQVLVTPEMAAEFIKHNFKDQRLLKPMLIEYLARALKSGSWNSDLPQPIMISEKGSLLDGQHRCHAIVKVGVPALCWVAFGVPESVYSDVDSGISRSLNDRIMLTKDDPARNKLACSVVTCWWFKDHNNRGRPNPNEAESHFKKHELSIRWVISHQSHDKGLARVQVAVAIAEMYERDTLKAQRLCDTVYHGDMKRPNGIRLREFLLKTVNLEKFINGHDVSLRRQLYDVCVGVCKAELVGKDLKRLTVDKW